MNIRDVKIDLMLGNPNEIVNEFIRVTDGISIINCYVYRNDGPEFIWYVGDKWIFYQDVKNEYFWCNYDNYWSIFESKFSLKYHEIQSITKFMVETTLKNGVGTPQRGFMLHSLEVETTLKNGVGTPGIRFSGEGCLLETAFKNEVAT